MSTEIAKRRLERVVMEDMKIIFRNLAGREGQYNRAGDRNFSVLLPAETAEAMAADGWNVKWLKAREEGDEPQAHLEVAVSYRGRPPVIVLITSKGRTTLPEDMVEFVDMIDIASVDLIINPYEWAVNGRTGVKAYLNSMYVIVQEDELMRKYADVPEIDTNGQPLELEAGEPTEDEIWDAEVVDD